MSTMSVKETRFAEAETCFAAFAAVELVSQHLSAVRPGQDERSRTVLVRHVKTTTGGKKCR